ncbi:MAG: GGDEF domain-containing protein [Candidatus Accumulibacter sp.]|jgi:diguanylate cyclase (GGDEF)-like protein|nr:GGDEF domain-containing protein [Accumulibacter sp.]
MLGEVRVIARSLSRGDLSGPLPKPDNELGSHLKSLHATLKHLTWQAREVAAGDYNQHVDFMGEFAEAFNQMIVQLKEQRDDLLSKIESNQLQQQRLERSNDIFKTITRQISEWILVIDRKTGELLFTNHPIEYHLSSNVFESQFYSALLDHAKQVVESDAPKIEELPLTGDEPARWFSVMFYTMRWYERDAVLALLMDITDSKAQIKKLEDTAYRDMLTGTYNRHYGMKLLNEWLEQRIPFAICFVDMDRLKWVNDVFGHLEGDRYILQVTNLLQTFSANACVCRLGGDEFMVLVPGVSGKAAEARLGVLRDGLVARDHKMEDGQTYQCSISFGIVEVAEDNTVSAVDLLSLADERMYAYKKAHKAVYRERPA